MCNDLIRLLMGQINFIKELIGKINKFGSLIWA